MTPALRTTIVTTITAAALGRWRDSGGHRASGHVPASSAVHGSDSQRRALYWYDPNGSRGAL